MKSKLAKYNNKEYRVIECEYMDQIIPFVIDEENYDKIMDIVYVFERKFNYRTAGGYISYNTLENGKKCEYYLHNMIMDHTPKGKGSTVVVDHINRIGTDNRKENLRIVSQSVNNQNRRKIKRIVDVPETSGIKADDIPTFIYYNKREGNHGEHFRIDVPGKKLVKTTKSKKYTLKQKLEQAKDILNNMLNDDIKNNHSLNGNLLQSGLNTEKSYYEILELAGYKNIKIINLPQYIKQILNDRENYFIIENHPNLNDIWTSDKSLNKSSYEKFVEVRNYLQQLEKPNNEIKKIKLPNYVYKSEPKGRGTKFFISRLHPKLKQFKISDIGSSGLKSISDSDKIKEILKLLAVVENYDTKDDILREVHNIKYS
jgi:hypothetical protein